MSKVPEIDKAFDDYLASFKKGKERLIYSVSKETEKKVKALFEAGNISAAQREILDDIVQQQKAES